MCFALKSSGVASPICQEGQSKRPFPNFAFSSRFVLFFPNFFPLFPDFPLFSSIFGKFFAMGGGGTLPHLDLPVATPLLKSH